MTGSPAWVCYVRRVSQAEGGLADDLRYLDDRIADLDERIEASVKTDPVAQRLLELRGVGSLTASALAGALGDGRSFAKGRDFAASLGLTPRQHSTGGKDRLLAGLL
jgi:transposase